jgi:hypothetical protein
MLHKRFAMPNKFYDSFCSYSWDKLKNVKNEQNKTQTFRSRQSSIISNAHHQSIAQTKNW